MSLTNNDLKQIDEGYIDSLSKKQLRHLSKKMLEDLRKARDQLSQTSQNSSRPPSSDAPWEKAGVDKPDSSKNSSSGESGSAESGSAESGSGESENKENGEKEETVQPKKPGKQPGSKGSGRTVTLPITGEEEHRPSECSACGDELGADVLFVARTGLYVLDIEREGMGGIRVTHVKHIYGSCACGCGHVTETKPGRCEQEDGWNVGLTEWHLVGPMLVSLIICLSLRMRLSRKRIQEFLEDWLGIALSTGCINQCITEGGRASAPLETELCEDIQKSELLHADETGWKENGRTVWLWVLRTSTATLYLIGSRSWDVIATVMEQFGGWLMSDGYPQYRNYAKRLRCLAHIIRKARGLADSCDPQAATFGQIVLEHLSLFISAIYEARGDPSANLLDTFAQQLDALKAVCQQYRDCSHDKTKKLARELLNDWDAIWMILAHPDLPITNNAAEQALRHWVIARKISFGTRSKQGSRAYALLASVIDTCRQRGVSPWAYIAQVIAQRRKGRSAPPLPSAC